jgi:hypothetical protein
MCLAHPTRCVVAGPSDFLGAKDKGESLGHTMKDPSSDPLSVSKNILKCNIDDAAKLTMGIIGRRPIPT